MRQLAHQLGGFDIRGVLFLVNLFLIAEQGGEMLDVLDEFAEFEFDDRVFFEIVQAKGLEI